MERTYISKIKPNKKILLKGWVTDIRDLGGLKFLILKDKTGIIQITAIKNKVEKTLLEDINKISNQSVIEVTGKSIKNKKAPKGIEILPSNIKLISLAQTPLPIDLSKKTDTSLDKRIDYRFLDTRRENISAIFKIRSQIFKATVDFFDSNKFININTPKITASGVESGAELFPIVYFAKKAYLAQSPQIYKQAFISGGFEKVYEIAPVFRAEKSHTIRHLTEFTGIDFEIGYIKDEKDVMDVAEGLLTHIVNHIKKTCIDELKLLSVNLPKPIKFPRITIDEAKKILVKKGKKLFTDDDLDAEAEKILGEYALKKYNSGFIFITDYPWKKRPFYHMKSKDPNKTRSFDLLYNGMEIATGAQREHRIDILEEQAKEKGINLDTMDFYKNIFKYGCPPHGGAGLGLDRITQCLLKIDNIKEVVLLPRDPERLTP